MPWDEQKLLSMQPEGRGRLGPDKCFPPSLTFNAAGMSFNSVASSSRKTSVHMCRFRGGNGLIFISKWTQSLRARLLSCKPWNSLQSCYNRRFSEWSLRRTTLLCWNSSLKPFIAFFVPSSAPTFNRVNVKNLKCIYPEWRCFLSFVNISCFYFSCFWTLNIKSIKTAPPVWLQC